MTAPTWDDVTDWIKEQREAHIKTMRRRRIDIRDVDRANAMLDLLDELEKLPGREQAPVQVCGTFVQ